MEMKTSKGLGGYIYSFTCKDSHMIRKAAARHVLFCTCDLVNLLSSLRSLEERSGAPEPFVDLMIRVDSLLISSEPAFEARFPDSNLQQRT